MDVAAILITVAGILAMILLPGMLLAKALFPKDELSDQLLYSLALGLTPQLLLYGGNTFLHIKITQMTTVLAIAFVCLAGVVKIIADWRRG